jgi:hypothetical protein
MATPNAPIHKDLDVAFELMVLARKTDQTSYAYQQLLLLILSTVQAAVVESSPHPSFYNAFESSGGPSVNPEVQDDGENEGEDGEDVEDTGEDTVEDTRQPVGCRRKWYTLVKTKQERCDNIPHVPQSEVLPHIMTRLNQMLNGTVDVYEVERVWFNHQADGWNVVFTFQRSPLNHAYPIRFKEGWMKVGHLHIKESFPSLA